MDIFALQNGSDIRGVASDERPQEKVNLSPQVVESIGYAFGQWLSARLDRAPSELRISIGHDSRHTAARMQEGLCRGLTHLGITVYPVGLATTPSMFYSTQAEGHKYEGAIMITASHLPSNRNGFKFFTPEGGLDKGDIRQILSLAAEARPNEAEGRGKIVPISFLEVYAASLRDFIIRSCQKGASPLKGFHILVDAGNGSGGFFADRVLEPLGAITKGSLYLDPDGRFPNHIPNPELPEALTDIQKAVVETGADMAVVFDTDVDRAALVDHTGKAVNRNALVALASAVILEEHPATWIVTDSITSDGLHTFIEQELGGRHLRFKRGYRNVINEARKLNREGRECHLAIETSGHAAVRGNQFLDDGAYLITLFLIKAARLGKDTPLTQLISGLSEPAEAEEVRIVIQAADFKAYGEKVIAGLEEYARQQEGWEVLPENYEGIRVKCKKGYGEGWFLLRLSLHDPVLPLNLESEIPGGIKLIMDKLRRFFKEFDQLHSSSLS